MNLDDGPMMDDERVVDDEPLTDSGQEWDLAAIGALIDVPQASTNLSPSGPRDRLAELAAWWATVAGSAPPRRVEQFWLTRPSSVAPAGAEVVIRRFDAPRDVADAVRWGVSVADDAVDDGTDLILLSIEDDARWQVLSAHLLADDAVEAMGWPGASGLSDADWIVRVAAIRDGLRGLRGIGDEPERLLERLGSCALAAGTGLLLQAAARRTPALLDGPGAATCALLADRVARAGRAWWQPTDAAADVLHDRVLAELRLTPLTRFGLRTEDGTAARIGLALLETAIARREE
jgi:Phosphoribosyltransferase